MQKMESIGQLAGGVAHDFNNMLTVIQGHASLLALEPTLTETAKESAKAILLAAESSATLTRQLLTFSRRQVIQTQELNLNTIIESVIKMLRRVLGKNVALQFTAGDIPPVLADVGMLEQVLMNLAVNAQDAMPDGGTLNIRTGVEIISEAFARQNPEASAGRFLWLEIADTRLRYFIRKPVKNFRAIFYDQRGRQRDGAWTGDRVWNYQATSRLDYAPQQGRLWDHVQNLPASPEMRKRERPDNRSGLFTHGALRTLCSVNVIKIASPLSPTSPQNWGHWVPHPGFAML
jgi:hypothetical protein